MTDAGRHFYLRDEATGRTLQSWPAEGLNARELHELEKTIRREHSPDDVTVVLRDSANDVAGGARPRRLGLRFR